MTSTKHTDPQQRQARHDDKLDPRAETIAITTANLTSARSRNLRAIILTGSMTRNEATWVQSGAALRVRGDAEFILVFHDKLPSDLEIGRLELDIQCNLVAEGIECKICLSPVLPSYLVRLKPHIFGFELISSGRVIWGDEDILSLVPPFSVGDIPLEDACRLLSNRLIELLEVIARSPTAEETRYNVIKLYLDMATSFLLFKGEYAPTYRARSEQLRTLAQMSNEPWPIRSTDFAETVERCTECKLNPESGEHNPPTWTDAVGSARLLWRWQLARLAGVALTNSSDDELLKIWMRGQSIGARLRGWAYVLRKRGWYRSWREWPHWLRLAWRSSPRYCIYAAACNLLFAQIQFPSGLRPAWWWLPTVPKEAGNAVGAWQPTAVAIARNYHDYLEFTAA